LKLRIIGSLFVTAALAAFKSTAEGRYLDATYCRGPDFAERGNYRDENCGLKTPRKYLTPRHGAVA